MPIDPRAFALHGISHEVVKDAPSTGAVSLALLAWLLQRCSAAGGTVPLLIAHNAE
jgi:hypothetical protein